MSTQDPIADGRLEFDLADRMRRALRVSGRSVQEIADSLEVSRMAVSSWINGHHAPRPRDLKAFALLTGFPHEWLRTGRLNSDVRLKGLEPPTFWLGVKPVADLAAARVRRRGRAAALGVIA